MQSGGPDHEELVDDSERVLFRPVGLNSRRGAVRSGG